MTRQFAESVAKELISGMLRHTTPSGALMDIPAEPVDRLEGVARTILLAGFHLLGCDGQDPEVAAWVRQAVTIGMDSTHPDSWVPQSDHGQATVEATVVAVAIHLTRPWVLDQLDPDTRERLLDWLASEHWCADNNHVLFGATCQALRHHEGRDVDEAAIWAALDHIEQWYVGDGWYSDGDGRRFDHYNAWTFHLYPFWILDLMDPDGKRTAERRALYRSRLRAFLESYRDLFAADGSFVAMGRSLLYRFGVLAPFWMAEIEECSPLAPGEAGALTRLCIQHFLDHDALTDGLLTLGWHHAHPSVLQTYNRPGSPLWAAKGLLGLVLPPEHRGWAEGVWAGPRGLRAHTGPGWLTWGHEDDGIVRLLNMGSDGHPAADDPLYRRSAYSSATLPSFTPGWVDQSIAPLQGTHLGRLRGVVRPDSGAQRVRWLAAGREVSIDHAVVVIDGAEVHVARCHDVVALPVAIGGWHAPVAIESHLGLLETDASSASHETHHDEDTALGRTRLDRVVLTPSGNELHAAWVTGLGSAAATAQRLATDLTVRWRDSGADIVGPHGRVHPAAYVSRTISPWSSTSSQRVYRWE